VPLEEVQVIDIGLKAADGAVELVITDAGVTIDPGRRLDLLREKLRTYANYIDSQEFEKDHPGIGRDRVRIRVICANPPSEEMAKLRDIGIKGDRPVNVPITYDLQPSPFTTSPAPTSGSAASPSTAGNRPAKLLKRLLTIALIIAVFVGWTMYNKSKASATVREQAALLVQLFPLYRENKDYYDSALDEMHDLAFDQAYKVGGRRTSASFDQERYHAMLVAFYRRKASQDGKAEIADALEEYRKSQELPVVEFPKSS
jgi:hypothetical protein